MNSNLRKLGFLGTLLWLIAALSRAEPPKPADDRPQQASKPSDQKDAGWTELFNGKDLGKWKRTEFGSQSEVQVKDGQIVIDMADGCNGITWQGDAPKGEYELSLEAKKVDGSDFFCGLTFPVADSHCTLIVGGWGGGLVGLSCMDGEDASHNNTSSNHELLKDRWYAIRLKVTEKNISAWIDKDQVVDADIEGHKISLRSEVVLSKPLGIATWNTTGAIRNIKWRKLEKAKESEKSK